MILKLQYVVNAVLLKGSRRIIPLLLLCGGIVLPAHAMGQTASAPLVLSNVTLPPVTTPAGDGYLDKLYAEWFSRAGLRAEMVVAPAARGLENANAGLIDGEVARISVDSTLYPNLQKIPEPVIQVNFSGLYSDPSISVKTHTDFRKYRVGHVRGWRIAERLFEGFDNVIAVRNAESLIDMLAANRLDIVFMTVAPARTLARVKHVKQLHTTEFRIEKYLFLYLHSSHHDKISIMTETLKSMKSDGSYDAIMAEYEVENQ